MTFVSNILSKKGKKGDLSIKYTILIILLLASFFFLFIFFIRGPAAAYDRVATDASCKASVLASVHLGVWDENEVRCPSNYLRFSKSDSDESIKKEMAQGLASCWKRFGEGKLLLFDHDPALFGSDKVAYCNVCEVYEFEADQSSRAPLSGFGEYLATHTVAKEYDLAEPKYLEYLTGVFVQEDHVETFARSTSQNRIDPSKSYAAVFAYTKDPAYLQIAYQLQQAFASSTPLGMIYHGGLALIFGKEVGADWYAQTLLIPYNKDRLRELCENLQE